MRRKELIGFWAFLLLVCGCTEPKGRCCDEVVYDVRDDLTPRRLTIAMWDFSWQRGHYPGGPFEDFEKAIDELMERGFNTVRIDAFPMVLKDLKTVDAVWDLGADPLATWGLAEKAVQHKPAQELIEFMTIAKEKGLYVILSSWGANKENYEKREDFWAAWEYTLDLLKERDLLSHVLYVDLDQEFPYFSPFQKQLNELADAPADASDDLAAAMEAAGKSATGLQKYQWNPAQMRFVHGLFTSSMKHFHERYPELRFTFSLTSFWEEVRAMNLKCFDVLEVHVWIHDPRFDDRTGFYKITKNRGDHDHSDYMKRIDATMESARPILLKAITNKMAFARDWADEMGVPLTTTESWGPWWHMDHKDLRWQWLYDWCEQCMALSSQYRFWGVTPWNYAHPYWDNWENIEWYRRVNGRFLDS